MKHLTFFLLLIFILIFSGKYEKKLYSQTTPVCKLTFCNCCGEDMYYHLYRMSDGVLIGTFWTYSSLRGCSLDSIANVVAGQHYYIDVQNLESNCKHDVVIRTYFTGCPCENGWQQVTLPCCEKAGELKAGNNIEKNNSSNQLSLYQNYPNPFNPLTTIKFSTTATSYVKLTVYDVTGKELNVLFDGTKDPGYQEIVWDATEYASGIYFYKLQSGEFVTEKKMIVVK